MSNLWCDYHGNLRPCSGCDEINPQISWGEIKRGDAVRIEDVEKDIDYWKMRVELCEDDYKALKEQLDHVVTALKKCPQSSAREALRKAGYLS
jgi:hypothetical protein